MSEQITLTLPDDVFRRAESLAGLSGRPVTDVLAETIEASLFPLGAELDGEAPMQEWTNDQVLATTEAQMPLAEDQRLTQLLDRQQDGKLNDEERTELRSLLASYQTALLRKARALAEAVRRGLRGPLEP